MQQDFLKDLRGAEAFKRYEEMRLNSPIVGALLLAIEHSVRAVSWEFTSDQGENDERIEFMQSALDGLEPSWEDHLSEALTMLPFGYSLFEIVYALDQFGRVTWRKLAVRGQDTIYSWDIDDNGTLIGAIQRGAPTYREVYLPADKCILYRTRVEKGNPEGRSMLRTAYIPYYYAKNISQIEAIGVERDLAGLPVIKLPEGASTGTETTSDASVANKLVRNIRQDEQAGIVLPSGWELTLLSTGGTRQFDTDKIINRYESRMLMAALAQFLMLGQEGVGSLALSKDQTDLFTMSVNTTADIIADTFRHSAVPRLLALNGWNDDGIKFAHTPAGDVDATMVADFLTKVQPMLTWTPQDEAWLRQIGKLPEVDLDEIEAERERKQEQTRALSDAALARNQKQLPPDGQTEPLAQNDEHEQMNAQYAAEYYAAERARNDARRRSWEKRIQRTLKKFLDGEKKRIVKGAKRIPR